jgi:hypothetical protein
MKIFWPFFARILANLVNFAIKMFHPNDFDIKIARIWEFFAKISDTFWRQKFSKKFIRAIKQSPKYFYISTIMTLTSNIEEWQIIRDPHLCPSITYNAINNLLLINDTIVIVSLVKKRTRYCGRAEKCHFMPYIAIFFSATPCRAIFFSAECGPAALYGPAAHNQRQSLPLYAVYCHFFSAESINFFH